MTPREAARLQGFPDEFMFAGTRQDMRTQIGNAVPPPLAKAIGEEIRRSLLVESGEMDKTAVSSPSLPAHRQLDLAV